MPEVCPPGTYSDPGAVNCKPCDAGYTCDEGATQPNPDADICDPGGWCDGKNRYECPAGTYNPNNGSVSQKSACIPCPAGMSKYK